MHDDGSSAGRFQVTRRDDGRLVVLRSAATGRVPLDERRTLATRAVDDLVAHLLGDDVIGWVARDVVAGLCLAGERVTGWSGELWPLSWVRDDPEHAACSAPEDEVVQLWGVVLELDGRRVGVGTYEDGGYNGLEVGSGYPLSPPGHHPLGPIGLPVGTVDVVEITLDVSVLAEPSQRRALVAEAALEVSGETVTLMTGEWDEDHGFWRRLDESVLLVRRGDLDSLIWHPARPRRRE